jgi:hypothetical protein
MKTKHDLQILLNAYRIKTRSRAASLKKEGPLQCSVGFISDFPEPYERMSSLDTFYKGFCQNADGYGNPGLLSKDRWPAIWLFTMKATQIKTHFAQDLIVGLNAVELYNYLHRAHNNRISLYMADPDYFNYDYIYDICEEQLKKRNK